MSNRQRESARALAYRALLRIDHEGAFANLLLPAMLSQSELHPQDRRFATELVYGTTRMRRACDAIVDRFVLTEPDPQVRTLLRLGAYQLVYAEVAPHAAVGETVSLAQLKARGFVNAVLRRVAKTPMVWGDDATRLSYPDWIVDRFVSELGEVDGMAALERMNVAPRVTTRDDGYIQDLGSQWVSSVVGASPDERILDLCAAPGGKATAMAATGAFVIAAEVQPHRAELIVQNSRALGADVPVVVADGANPPFGPATFDRVLVDAPCSGLGSLRRRPDARWRITPDDIVDLAALQGRLLSSAAALVRPGGVLVYSVCTITAEESIDHPVPAGFDVIDSPLAEPWTRFGHGFRLVPHAADTDGMIVVRYRCR